MEQESTSNNQSQNKKIYKDREIWVGTLLGGTLAAGWMVAQNYRAFGETNKVWKTWLATVAATAFVILVSFAPYIDRLPNSLFGLICAGIVVVLAQMFQGEQIKRHIKAGWQIQSWWKTIGVSLIALVVTVILILGIAVISEYNAGANVTTKTFGTLKHEILFDKTNLTEAEADKIGAALTKTTFFDEEKQKFVDAKKIGNDYEIFLYCNETIKTDADSIEYFRQLRSDMQKRFPNNRIIFNLVIGTPDNIVKRLE